MSQSFHILVLGGGPGGVAAAIRGAQLGARVGIVENTYWGGLCLNRACVPTKLLTTTMERIRTAQTAAGMGFRKAEADLDPAALFGLKKELVDYFSMGTRGLLQSKGVTVIEGRGRLSGRNSIAVDEETVEAEAIIVAAGAEWVRPAFPGSDLPGVLSWNDFLEENAIPGRTLILGAGPWGLELAQFLSACGGQAVVAESGRGILPGIDQEISQRLRGLLKTDAAILNTCRVVSLEKGGDGLRVRLSVKDQAETRIFDRVVYFERKPATAGLGLDAAGLEDLRVDDRMATRVKGIWAVGDVTDRGPFLSHHASAMGIVAAENALGGNLALNPRAVPLVVYTHPQAASVGLTEDAAEEAGYDAVTGTASLGVSPMAMIQGASNGVIKVVGESRYGELLGVHLLAPFATEIIGAAALAIQMEATLEDLARCALPHPTIAESLADAARDALGWAIYVPG
jgi:dihydrolipoamide dehydrogenase